MRSFILLTLWFITSITKAEETGETDSNETSAKEYVVTLTQENFVEFVDKQERTLVEFYAPWCGHCKALAPKYEEAARILSQEKVSPTALAKVDATEAPVLASTFKIEGYPTLVLIEGKETIPFDGGRETQNIVDWVLKHDIPAYTLITYAAFEQMKTAEIDLETEPDKEFQIFAFVKKGSKKDRLFNSFANELRGEKVMSFYKIYLQKRDKYRVVMWRNNQKDFSDALLDGEREVSYNGRLAPSKKSLKSLFSFDTYDIGTWMHEHRLPFFVNLEQKDTTHPYSILYNSPKTPRAGIILIRVPENDESAVMNLKKELISVARELRANEGYMLVLTSKDIDRIGFTQDVSMLLVQKKILNLPKVASGFKAMEGEPNRNSPASYFVEQFEKQSGMRVKEVLREYRYQYFGDIDSAVLRAFVNDLSQRQRWLRSAANTEKSEDIYYDIVSANTFEEYALDQSSDVLVLYCTQWGRYCQPLMEEYNKLAKHVQTFYKGKSIKIGYLDCDENDVEDIRVDAFPTMVFYTGGTDKILKGKVLSQEQRTVDEIVDFIDEYATSLNKDEL